MARIQQFLADLDQNPLPGIGDRMLTEALGTYAILSYLYFPPNDWDILRFGLDAAFQGDGSVLMEMMDDRIAPQPGRHVRQQRQRGVLRGVVPGPAGGGRGRPRG